MIRIEFENENSSVAITTKNTDSITWISMIMHFADVLNGASYVIDRSILEEHLLNAQGEMCREMCNKVSAFYEDSETAAVEGEKYYSKESEVPF
jgi:hypothetical protein